MPIRQITPMSEIRKATQDAVGYRIAAVESLLSYAGEQAVNEARTSHSYTDQTGNLTASIGYAVIRDGAVVRLGDFNPVKSSSAGQTTGRSFAESLASRFPKGITLLVVAGMKYAKYVAARGYNVLDSSESVARSLVSELLIHSVN